MCPLDRAEGELNVATTIGDTVAELRSSIADR
jgi:hypothetical protein